MTFEATKSKINVNTYELSESQVQDVIWLKVNEDQIIDFINHIQAKFVLTKRITLLEKLSRMLGRATLDESVLKVAVNNFYLILEAKIVKHSGNPVDEFNFLTSSRDQMKELFSFNLQENLYEYEFYIPFENRIYGFRHNEYKFVLPDVYFKQELLKCIK